MTRVRIYVNSAAQISIQRPLCDKWMTEPLPVSGSLCPAIDPDFREFLTPLEARRMGRMIKRAVAVSLTSIRESGISRPDAIITGTGLGCMEYSENILVSLDTVGEGNVKPSAFMQSTHNTIGSIIGIKTCNHGYNCTYSHLGISFELSLADAWTQLSLGKISSALVGCHDEMTPAWFSIFRDSGYVPDGLSCPVGEASVAFMISSEKDRALAELGGVKTLYKPDMKRLAGTLYKLLEDNCISMDEVSCIMAGLNGNSLNDRVYTDFCNEFCPGIPVLSCKPVFGESLSSSALSFYCSLSCIRYGYVPVSMTVGMDSTDGQCIIPENILIFNHSDNKEFSFVLLKSCVK